MATKKCLTTNFFSPLSFLPDFGSRIRDPRSGIRDPGSGIGKNRDPGSGINIPDPPQWTKLAGSGSRSGVGSEFRVRSESVSQRYRSMDLDPDPDPYQSVTDPKHLFVLIKTYKFFTRRWRNRLVNWLKFYYQMRIWRICAFKVKLVFRCVEINWFQTKLV